MWGNMASFDSHCGATQWICESRIPMFDTAQWIWVWLEEEEKCEKERNHVLVGMMASIYKIAYVFFFIFLVGGGGLKTQNSYSEHLRDEWKTHKQAIWWHLIAIVGQHNGFVSLEFQGLTPPNGFEFGWKKKKSEKKRGTIYWLAWWLLFT